MNADEKHADESTNRQDARSAVDLILSRRSIRAYELRPVPRETLTLLLRAAMAAPTAANSQPWEFVVVTDSAVLAALRDKLVFGRYGAPAAIAVCANERLANNSAARHYWVQDCSAAMENLLLAAVGLGLGAVWIGVHPLPSVIKPVSEVLALPAGVVPLGIAYVGYPAETKPARTQYDERRVHWDQYEERKRRARLKNAKHQ